LHISAAIISFCVIFEFLNSDNVVQIKDIISLLDK
jgi:hypothetical protein